MEKSKIHQHRFDYLLDRCLKNINFDNILAMMGSVDWLYVGEDEMTEGVLVETVHDMGESLFRIIYTEPESEIYAIGTGGFELAYFPYTDSMVLKFVAEEWSEGEDGFI